MKQTIIWIQIGPIRNNCDDSSREWEIYLGDLDDEVEFQSGRILGCSKLNEDQILTIAPFNLCCLPEGYSFILK